MEPHKVTLHVVTNTAGKRIVVCEPSEREKNRIKVGRVIRFEAADPSHKVEMGLDGEAKFAPGTSGTSFNEFTAASTGNFGFTATLTLPDQTVIQWEPDFGGQGEVQF